MNKGGKEGRGDQEVDQKKEIWKRLKRDSLIRDE